MAIAVLNSIEINTDPENGDFCFSACPRRDICKIASAVGKLVDDYVKCETDFARRAKDADQLSAIEFHEKLAVDTTAEPLVDDPRFNMLPLENLADGFSAYALAEAMSVIGMIWRNRCVDAMSQATPNTQLTDSIQRSFSTSGY